MTNVGGLTIQGNLIGVNAAGTAANGNGGAGIYLDANNGSVASTVVQGNVVSGNGYSGCPSLDSQEPVCSGIVGYNDGFDGTTIVGNLIGTNLAGTAAIPNASDGVHLEYTYGGITVGGTTVADRNIISGNGGHGIRVLGGSNAVIEGNNVGTNTAGTAAIGNGIDGIAVDGAYNNTISGNLSSGNTGMGISLFDGASSNTITGNTLGTNAAATAAIANFEGIRIDGASDEHDRKRVDGRPATGRRQRGCGQPAHGHRGLPVELDRELDPREPRARQRRARHRPEPRHRQPRQHPRRRRDRERRRRRRHRPEQPAELPGSLGRGAQHRLDPDHRHAQHR